jgi:poly(3-hydroxybutyrate) depolymerase
VWSNTDPRPGEYQPDDVTFLTNLITRIGATVSLDPHRTYSGGFSAGSVMCHYLGAKTTNLFAALAVVEGSIGADQRDGIIVTNPPAAGPMPVLLVNATNDCKRPYYGGLNNEGTLVTPAIAAAYYWTNANLCSSLMSMTVTNFASSNITRFEACGSKQPAIDYQTNQIITRVWTNCFPGTEVMFVTVTDGGHEWQDASDNVGWDSNLEVPRFFLRHARP